MRFGKEKLRPEKNLCLSQSGCGKAHDAQDCVLGYFQPELSKLARKWPSGRRNLLNAWKRTWTREIGLVLWQCFRPSTSTNAKVGCRPQICHPDRSVPGFPATLPSATATC